MATHTLEKMYEIWNDKTGDRIEVGPGAMDLFEIRQKDSGGTIGPRITLDYQQAEMLIHALTDLLDDKRIADDNEAEAILNAFTNSGKESR